MALFEGDLRFFSRSPSLATRLPFISPYRKASLPFAPVFINHDGCVMFHRSRNENNSCGIHFVALIWAESAKLGTRYERNSGYFHFVADGKWQSPMVSGCRQRRPPPLRPDGSAGNSALSAMVIRRGGAI